MSRVDRLREIARTSHFAGERENAARLADRLAGQRSERSRAAAAFLNDLTDAQGDQRWRETPTGWECTPAPNDWCIAAGPLRLSDEQLIAQAIFEGGGEFA